MKVVSLVGARPQFIKEAVLNEEFKKNEVEEIIVNSGQHYDYNMADIFFEKLGVTIPKYNLEVGSGKHGEMTAKIMTKFEDLLYEIQPDVVLVYGDTNTTVAGALVATKMKIPLAHVEAGVRMLPKDMPEEINRVITDHVSNFLFCPSKRTVENLKKENITEGVYFTGDVTYDLYLQMKDIFDYSLYEKLDLQEGKFAVVTIHRDYNVDDKVKCEKIFKALAKIAKDKRVVFPMHPRTKKRVEEFGLEEYVKDLDVLEPIGYLELMGLMHKCDYVITDSGGLQREAYFSKKRAYLLMPDPAWHEIVEEGMNVLCEPEELYEKVSKSTEYNYVPNLYGKGDSGKQMVKILLEENGDKK
jgi:UDP-N-acetylglucosamine 2-epimerase (non-hydrolysing)